MTIPVKPLNEIQEKSEVSASDKILILDSVSEEARLAPKSELKGDKGDKGDTGAKGATGSKGDKGDTGETGATIVGATFSGNDIVFGKDDGSYITLTDAKTTLKGPKGDTGNSSTISVGTTSTGNPGTDASVTNSGTSSAAVLNFTIPQGQVGATGNGIESITHSKSGKVTTVVITETNGDTSSFEILDGKDGNSGAGSGDVIGPEGATDGHLAVYDGTTGKLIKDGGAVPTVRNSKIEIQKNGTKVGDFTLNQASNKAIDIPVPTKTSDLSNDSGFITSSALPTKVSDLTNDSGFITGIDSTDVTTALGYTPANSASLGTASTKDTGTSSGNIPVLDSDGKLATSTLPGVALTDTFTVSTSSDLTSLSSADQGDIAIVTSENKTYVLSVAPYSTASNWKEILAPTGGVTSVNGQTGAVTVSEFAASAGGTKVFDYPTTSVEDIVTWCNGGGTAILMKSDGPYVVSKVGTSYITSVRDNSGDGGTFGTGSVYVDMLTYNNNTYALISSNDVVTYNHFKPGGTATTGYVLTKTANGYGWSAPSGGDVVVSSQTGNILQSGMKIWAGSSTDYGNLGTYDSNCLYLVIE